MTDIQTEQSSEPTPEILHEGRYRLWAKPDGGLHLVYQRTDKDEPDHMELPGPMVRLFNSALAGNMSLGEMMREAMKLRNQGVV